MMQERKMVMLSRTTPYSPTCMKIMDLFLKYPQVYFTPITVSLSLEVPIIQGTAKTCLSLLAKNSYLVKNSKQGHVFHMTKASMEFWATDFRNHVKELAEKKGVDFE